MMLGEIIRVASDWWMMWAIEFARHMCMDLQGMGIAVGVVMGELLLHHHLRHHVGLTTGQLG